MEKLKAMLWQFKNNENTTETAEKISSVYGFITNCQIQNWFSKFRSGDMSLRDESRPGCSSDFDQDSFQRIGGM